MLNMNDETMRKLRWSCRRGMLELDIILSEFLENHFASISNSAQNSFIRLLACEDQQLYNWLIKHESCENQEFQTIIKDIIHAKSYP